MPKYKTALVTGGAGFIGSHIVDALIKRHIKVFVVDDLSSGSKENVNPNAEFIKLSITNPQFPKLIKKLKPELVIHAAAQLDVRKSVENPLHDAKVNIQGSLSLFSAAAEHGAKKIIFISTGGAMFNDSKKPPYSEKQEADPISPYGIAKFVTEKYLRFYHEYYGVDYTVLRLANVYGPRQSTKGEAGVVAIFSRMLLDRVQPQINGTGKQTRDYVYVGDVVRAVMSSISKKTNCTLHIGTGKEVSVKQLFKKMNKISGAKLKERYAPAKSGEVMRSALDTKQAKRVLGWTPKVDIDSGLEKTIKWFAKQTSKKR